MECQSKIVMSIINDDDQKKLYYYSIYSRKSKKKFMLGRFLYNYLFFLLHDSGL